ncbi:MAG: valine--tRNA ligase [Candidatus Woesearchaeota archaeon]
MEIPKKYDAAERESYWKRVWEEHKTYAHRADPKKEAFVIDTPPPTMSGRMHVGHAYSYAQTDFVARFKRMTGYKVVYPFGTDDNGVATERLVERERKVLASRMRRDEFIALCEEYVEETRPGFVDDWKRIGISCDFDLFYSTISDKVRALSQKHFLDLVRSGRAYRKEAPMIWDPKLQTALSQTELEDREQETWFCDIAFKTTDGHDVLIATTRPEMLSACVAVFVHPEDTRWTHLHGHELVVPVYGHTVRVMADNRVDPEKGTGIVMCCTFGDQTDIEWYRQYGLPLRIAITKDGKMAELAARYAGMTIREAREAITGDMESSGELVSKKRITHSVNVGERSGVEIEILETPQWFIKVLDRKADLEEAAASIDWKPTHMRVRFDNWNAGLNWDWCVSRQRFFGVPIPIWYDERGEPVLPSDDELPFDPMTHTPKGTRDVALTPETDVLDTWATSSLTPMIVRSLLSDDDPANRWPLDLRPQAHDIITFWLYNSTIRGLEHEGSAPWKTAAISGWVLDPKGKKMSKSKGNVIDPRVVMEKYSADALRYAAAIVKLGDDAPFQEKDVQQGFKTATKLFNAVKFSVMHLEKAPKGSLSEEPSALVDRWLRVKLERAVRDYLLSFEEYAYDKARAAADRFFWDVFTNDYIEFAKHRLYDENDDSAYATLRLATLSAIKLYAPLMPFVTEEVFHYYPFEDAESIHSTRIAASGFSDDDALVRGDLLSAIIGMIRKAKSEAQVSMRAEVEVLTLTLPEDELALLDDEMRAEIRAIMSVAMIETQEGERSVVLVFAQ